MMNRMFVLVFLSFLVVSCNKKESTDLCDSLQNEEVAGTDSCTLTTEPVGSDGFSGIDDGNGTPEPDDDAPVTGDGDADNSGLPNAAYTFDANIDFISMTLSQEEKFTMAIDLIKKIVATEEFRSRVLNHTYNGVLTYVDNGGFSNAQIYQKILDGAETLRPAKNNTMDMGVELYYADNNVIGYTNTGTTQIWVNTKYFNSNPIRSVASNLMHEWLHKLGFKHAVNYSVSRDYSVPYAIGRIISTLGSTMD